MNDKLIITRIDYHPIDMSPIIILSNGKKLNCTYNDGGESLKATARYQLEKLIGHSYESIKTLKWYLVDKEKIVKKVESNLNMNLQDMTIKMLQESFKGDEELIEKFKTNAPNFYNVCLQLQELSNDVEIKPTYSTEAKQTGTYEVNISFTLSNTSSYKCYLNSKGLCKLKPTHFVLDDTTIDFLTKLNNILVKFEKHPF